MQQAQQAYDAVAEKERRDQLILEHLPLVRHLVGKLIAELPPGIDVDNLESAGILGLVEAAHHFDPERGVQFKTYAYTRIRGADTRRAAAQLSLAAAHAATGGARAPGLRRVAAAGDGARPGPRHRTEYRGGRRLRWPPSA